MEMPWSLSYGWLEERSGCWINGFRVARIEVLVGLHAFGLAWHCIAKDLSSGTRLITVPYATAARILTPPYIYKSPPPPSPSPPPPYIYKSPPPPSPSPPPPYIYKSPPPPPPYVYESPPP
ncbi:hypothetical protein LguiA_021612 [Lonicera macranthoides]